MSAPTLRPYQEEGLEAVATAQVGGQNRLLLQMATGTGKTVLFAELPRKLRGWLAEFPEKERKVLVIAHREELLDQAARKLHAAHPDLVVSVEQADRHAHRFSDIVVASIQTLAHGGFKRLHQLLTHHRFRIVVIDEAHHAAADTYRTALVHLGFLPPAEASDKDELEAATWDDVGRMEEALKGWDDIAPKDRLLLGVTATPNRSDAIGLGCVFQSLVFTYPIKRAVEDGHLSPIVPWVIETDTNLDDVRLTAGEFNQKDLAEAVNNEVRNRVAVQAWMEHAMGLSTLAFTVDVAHAHALADAFNRAGAVARPLSGQTPKEERKQLLRDFESGQVQIITNCMVLTEGTDLPITGCILHAKPTRSATLYEQMTGRGLRPYPGKPHCLVLDIVDVSRRHSLQTAPVLYGLPPGLNTEGDELGKMAADLEALRDKYDNVDLEAMLANARMSLKDLGLKASTFDIWKIEPIGMALGAGRALEWTKVGDQVYRLSYPWADSVGVEGTETIEISRDMLNQFEVVLTWREKMQDPRDKRKAEVRQRTIANHLTAADQAAGIAEAFVLRERRTVAGLKAIDAPWQKKPASDKQKNYLRRLRVPFKENLTMGQAGRLIDMAVARRGRR